MLQTRALLQKVQPGGPGGIDSPAPIAYRRGGKSEIATVQVDPYLQGAAPQGGDAFGGNVSTGIVLPQTVGAPAVTGRFLCLLAYASFQQGRRVRLTGIRQYLSIGSAQTTDAGVTTYFEKQVTSPIWRFPDGNVSWHVMALPPNPPKPAFLAALPTNVTGNIGNQLPGFAFVNTRTPAILSLTSAADNARADGAAYTPPNGGRPYGQPLTPDLGNIHDVRWPWNSANSWHYSVDVPLRPPCDVALYVSVKQTNVLTRNNPVLPEGVSASVLSPEDQFYLAFANATETSSGAAYWRVAGALTFAEQEERDQ